MCHGAASGRTRVTNRREHQGLSEASQTLPLAPRAASQQIGAAGNDTWAHRSRGHTWTYSRRMQECVCVCDPLQTHMTHQTFVSNIKIVDRASLTHHSLTIQIILSRHYCIYPDGFDNMFSYSPGQKIQEILCWAVF